MAQSRARLFLDPWPPEYDSAVQIDAEELQAAAEIKADVETSDWKPIRSQRTSAFSSIYFVDGVRRVDARVISHDAGQVVYGLFGTTGVGTVCRTAHAAQLGLCAIRRFLVLGGGRKQTEWIRAGGSTLEFEGIATSATTPQDVVAALQNLMRDAEANLGQSVLAEDSCVFVDGPLTYYSTATQALVGIVKRIHRLYLPPENLELLARLNAGERTPLFAIFDNKYDRYSCYLRLSVPQGIEHSFAGLIRLEMRATIGLEKCLDIVDYACRELPPFASSSVRDPRAPQNLLPIGALEEELRRRLGDSVLIRRAIEERISEGVLV